MNPFDNDNNNGNNGMNNMFLPPNYAVVQNKETQEVKVQKVGFSFTTLVFGIWPSVFRGDFYNTLCMIGVDFILAMVLTFLTGLNIAASAYEVFLIMPLAWSFVYNMMFFRHLQNKGFVPIDKRSAELLKRSHYFK
ncbi:hypothetical protein [Fructilactobacillus fructivorans]|nr:hypothetical protein [Fructilactobacillus fructivorans]KID41114.1 hypothetical protein LfDm3_1260 [Fructilactobacillus fructivorans]KRK57449.1 hypothetical protein FC73_GL000994 [Fructilactobacillus fructivorans]KRN12402.1 hypothetical protein IV37_GL001179 [Fructilactobacillus fructivorans]KRN41105.1 hypothetical protein IV51_GL000850 [Fructilactobacillus fructivorans]